MWLNLVCLFARSSCPVTTPSCPWRRWRNISRPSWGRDTHASRWRPVQFTPVKGLFGFLWFPRWNAALIPLISFLISFLFAHIQLMGRTNWLTCLVLQWSNSSDSSILLPCTDEHAYPSPYLHNSISPSLLLFLSLPCLSGVDVSRYARRVVHLSEVDHTNRRKGSTSTFLLRFSAMLST